jgi:hypothetical protein
LEVAAWADTGSFSSWTRLLACADNGGGMSTTVSGGGMSSAASDSKVWCSRKLEYQ